MLTLLVSKGTTTDPQIFWDAYYHLFLDETATSVLDSHLRELLDLSASPHEWRQSKFGGIFHFSDSFTLRAVRRVWSQYAQALSDKDSEGYRSRFKTALERSREFQNATFGKDSVLYGGTRAAAPLGMNVMADADLKTTLDTWWEHGTTGSRSDTTSTPNPLFSVSLSDNSVLLYGSNPILSFHLVAARAHLSESSPLRLPDTGDEHAPASNLVLTAQLQFYEWVRSFADLPSESLVLRFIVSDAFALCHTLQRHSAEGATSANLYQRQFSPERLELDAAEYAEGGAPSKFDVIDTSNLSDYSGALNILVSAGPLMKGAPWSTLYTETMDKGVDGEKTKFEELLCGPTKTVSTLLGISPVEYWTNATATSHVDEYMLAAAAVPSQKTSEQPSIQWRFAWKLNSHFAGQPFSTRINVSADDAATLIHMVYQGMFPHENPMALLSLSRSQQIETVNKQTYPKHHRGSLVVFIKRLLQVVNVNTESVCRKVLAKIGADSTLIFGSNFAQSLSLEMSSQGLYSEDWLSDAIRRRPDGGLLATWTDVSKGVYITMVVPKDSWKWVHSAAVTSRIAFAVEGSMRYVQSGAATWHNLFADIHVVFGSVEAIGERASPEFSVSVKEDQLRWAGESSIVVTFHVPAVAVQLDPKNTRVGLCVQSGVQNVTKLKAAGKLGQEMQIAEVELTNAERVFITKHPPGLDSCPTYGSLKPEQPVEVEHAEGAPRCSASLDSNGHITSMTSHIDVSSLEGKRMLKDKAGTVVHQKSPFLFELGIGNRDAAFELPFPVPVDKEGSKTRIARTSGYVEIIAPLANPATTQAIDDFIFPTTLASVTTKKIPVTLNIPHLNLDTLPIIDASDKQRLSFLTTLASWTFSNRERKLREQTVGSSEGGLAPSARLNFKESLFTMFMLASGLQGGQTGLFAINHPEKGGIHMLIFVSAIRLDGAHASVALDAAVIPFTVDMIKSGELESFLLVLRSLECCTVTVDDHELVLWKKVLPALVERCRNWSHSPVCEYAQPGATIPLSTEPGKQVICGCGAGKLPEHFIGLPEWETAAKLATRMAISPTYAVPFVEEVVDMETLKRTEGPSKADDVLLRCRNCGAIQGKSRGALKKCMRCLRVQYCSVQCQKMDWKKHRMECEEAAPAWEGAK